MWVWIRRALGLLLSLTGSRPTHVAFIMDGNRRFAYKEAVEKVDAHTMGYSKMVEVIHWCLELGVRYISVYAFSIDNFKRSPQEVEDLMRLAEAKYNELAKVNGLAESEGIEMRMLGDLSLAPHSVQGAAARLMRETAVIKNKKAVLNICFSYTATEETVAAVDCMQRAVSSGGLLPSDISPTLFTQLLRSSDCPPVDLLVRTSGETRLSDFLLWQSSSAQLAFVDRLWPDFGFCDFARCVLSYQRGAAHQQRVRQSCMAVDTSATTTASTIATTTTATTTASTAAQGSSSPSASHWPLSYMLSLPLSYLPQMFSYLRLIMRYLVPSLSWPSSQAAATCSSTSTISNSIQLYKQLNGLHDGCVNSHPARSLHGDANICMQHAQDLHMDNGVDTATLNMQKAHGLYMANCAPLPPPRDEYLRNDSGASDIATCETQLCRMLPCPPHTDSSALDDVNTSPSGKLPPGRSLSSRTLLASSPDSVRAGYFSDTSQSPETEARGLAHVCTSCTSSACQGVAAGRGCEACCGSAPDLMTQGRLEQEVGLRQRKGIGLAEQLGQGQHTHGAQEQLGPCQRVQVLLEERRQQQLQWIKAHVHL